MKTHQNSKAVPSDAAPADGARKQRKAAKANPNGTAAMKTIRPDKYVAWKGKGGAAEGKISGC